MTRKRPTRQRFFGRWQEIPAWARGLARVGYFAKALVYLLIGGIAFYDAVGRQSAHSSPTAAMHLVQLLPLGTIGLGALAAGMFCYGLHRAIESALGPLRTKSLLFETLHRVGRLSGGMAYLGFAALAVTLLFHQRSNSGGPMVADRVMHYPLGNSAIVMTGVVLISVGVKYFYDAISGRYHRSYDLDHPSRPLWLAVEIGGIYGICARGLFFLLCGALVIYSGLASDPSRANGMQGVLNLIRTLPLGQWLFGVIAIGFVAYGLFCGVRALYGTYPSDAGV